MATITSDGITGTTLAQYKTQLETAYKNSLGSDLDVSAQTPQGQLIGIDSLNFATLDASVVQLFNAMNILTATGALLDSFGAPFNIVRLPATSSVVTAQVTGVPATVIPSGSRAKTTSGNVFLASAPITLDPTGNGSGNFSSEQTGAIPIDASTLTQIVDVVPGWETINNSSAGTLGTAEQTDAAFLNSYYARINQNALSTLEAIRSSVLATQGVTATKVFDNTGSTNVIIQGVTLLPHSIAVIVEGGVAQDIGNAIAVKTVGANTEGGNTAIQTAVIVPTNGGTDDITIYYYPAELLTVSISMTIQLFSATSNVIGQIKSRIIEYFNGTFSSCTDAQGNSQFDSSGINISEPSYESRLYTPINSVTGFEVTALSQEIQGSGTPQSVITPNLNQRLIVNENSISVTVA